MTYNGAVFASLRELLDFMNGGPIAKTKIISLGFDSNSGFYFIVYEV